MSDEPNATEYADNDLSELDYLRDWAEWVEKEIASFRAENAELKALLRENEQTVQGLVELWFDDEESRNQSWLEKIGGLIMELGESVPPKDFLPEFLAREFGELSAKEQSDFFEHLAHVTKNWSSPYGAGQWLEMHNELKTRPEARAQYMSLSAFAFDFWSRREDEYA